MITCYRKHVLIRNSSEMTVEEWDHVKHWRDPVYGNIFIVLTIFIVR